MRNFRILLQYEGTRYQGWQRQESTENTIQGKLEALLTKMTGTPVEVQGAGRTDAGVHALGQTANFHADTQMTPEQIRSYINRYLPEDIAVLSVEEAGERFHSRLNAKGKTYCYQIINGRVPSVFDRRYAWQVEEALDISSMKKAAQILVGTHDFQSFTSAKKGKKATVRTIDSIDFQVTEYTQAGAGERKIKIMYRGDGFLYHMVRILTGTLVEVGTGQIRVEQMKDIMTACDRKKSGMLAPAKGLTLVEVWY